MASGLLGQYTAWAEGREWAVHSFLALSGVALSCVLVRIMLERSPAAEAQSSSDPAFRRFQRSYLSVYVVIMLADWLQGTHMYTLYTKYAETNGTVSVGTLFFTGFMAAGVLGTFTGPLVDRYGRKRACLVYVGLELAINALEHLNSMPLLLLGRVLGGVSTSLLFSAFEAWMVTEHRRRGFREEWLGVTFGAQAVWNGACAIVAGFAAQARSRKPAARPQVCAARAAEPPNRPRGRWRPTSWATSARSSWRWPSPRSPACSFCPGPRTMAALARAPTAALCVRRPRPTRTRTLATAPPPPPPPPPPRAPRPRAAREAPTTAARRGARRRGGGGGGRRGGGGGAGAGGRVARGARQPCAVARGDDVRALRGRDVRLRLQLGAHPRARARRIRPRVWPRAGASLLLPDGGHLARRRAVQPRLPRRAQARRGHRHATRADTARHGGTAARQLSCYGVGVYAVAAGCMGALVLCSCADCGGLAFLVQFGACLGFEVCVGAFQPCIATHRSKYVPDSRQSTVNNLFRFPLNMLAGTMLSDVFSPAGVFAICAAAHATATLCQLLLAVDAAAAPPAAKAVAKAGASNGASNGAAGPRTARSPARPGSRSSPRLREKAA